LYDLPEPGTPRIIMSFLDSFVSINIRYLYVNGEIQRYNSYFLYTIL
jgi:hypothetical protein